MLCALILDVSGGTKWQIFNKLLMAIFIYSPNFCQKSAVRELSKKYFFFSYFVLMPDLGYEPGPYV